MVRVKFMVMCRFRPKVMFKVGVRCCRLSRVIVKSRVRSVSLRLDESHTYSLLWGLGSGLDRYLLGFGVMTWITVRFK